MTPNLFAKRGFQISMLFSLTLIIFFIIIVIVGQERLGWFTTFPPTPEPTYAPS